jgi:two-component system NtrC family response regulator
MGAISLDLRMPDMDGLDVLRKVRRRASVPQVVVLTAFATAANTIEVMWLGAFDHLTKPIARQKLATHTDFKEITRAMSVGGI